MRLIYVERAESKKRCRRTDDGLLAVLSESKRERERFDTHKEYGVEQIDHRGRGRHIDASRRRRSSSSSRASSVRETTASAFTDSANDANANDECSVCYGSSDGLFQSSRHDWVSEYVWDDEQQCWRIPAGRDRPGDGGGVCERLLRALGAGWEKHRCERERISSSDDVDFEWERASITTATAATTTTADAAADASFGDVADVLRVESYGGADAEPGDDWWRHGGAAKRGGASGGASGGKFYE